MTDRRLHPRGGAAASFYALTDRSAGETGMKAGRMLTYAFNAQRYVRAAARWRRVVPRTFQSSSGLLRLFILPDQLCTPPPSPMDAEAVLFIQWASRGARRPSVVVPANRDTAVSFIWKSNNT